MAQTKHGLHSDDYIQHGGLDIPLIAWQKGIELESEILDFKGPYIDNT